jgi:hypothetical protein
LHCLAGEVQRTKAYARWAKATAAKPPPSVDPFALEEGSGGGGKKGSKKGGKKDVTSESALIAAIRGNVRAGRGKLGE